MEIEPNKFDKNSNDQDKLINQHSTGAFRKNQNYTDPHFFPSNKQNFRENYQSHLGYDNHNQFNFEKVTNQQYSEAFVKNDANDIKSEFPNESYPRNPYRESRYSDFFDQFSNFVSPQRNPFINVNPGLNRQTPYIPELPTNSYKFENNYSIEPNTFNQYTSRPRINYNSHVYPPFVEPNDLSNFNSRRNLPQNKASAFDIMRKWNLKFSGNNSEDPETFLMKIIEDRTIVPVEDLIILQIIPFFLSGIALHWYRSFRHTWKNFHEFSASFISRFGDVDFQFELRQEIYNRTPFLIE